MPDTTVAITGNLTSDPELRHTPNGAVANFTVAVTPQVKDGDGWRDGETSFFRCAAWRALAEHLADSLSKGDRVMVSGTLRQRSWQTEDGERRSAVEVQAEEVDVSLRWAIVKPQRTRRTNDDSPS